MGFLVLTLVFLSGYPIFAVFNKKSRVVSVFPYLFVFGSAASIPFLYFTTSFITHNLNLAIIIWIIAVILSVVITFRFSRPKLSLKSLIIFSLLTFFTLYFFQRSFSYNNNTFYIASNIYSDLNLHLSTIRSFSAGENFPFELPYFAGKNVTYHFFYDFYTGIMESLGMRVDVAYNLLFSLTFVSLFFLCLDAGKNIFKRAWIGFLAFLLIIFSPDFSFISIILDHKHNLLSLRNLNNYYLDSFLGSHTMGNFLYFNTFLNQRHLFFSLTLSLSIFIQVWKVLSGQSKSRLTASAAGILIGLMPFWNFPVFVCIFFTVVFLFLLFKRFRELFYTFIFAFFLAYPQVFSLQSGLTHQIEIKPGFLISENFSLTNITLFWVLNLGLAIITIIGGFIISDKNRKKLFFVLLPIFIIPNILKLGIDMFHNQKLFSFWFMYASFFSASFIYFLILKSRLYKLAGFLIVIFSTISGVLGFIVIKNDVNTAIPDYSHYNLVRYVSQNLPRDEVIVSNGEIYDPLSVSGRKTYIGRTNDIFWFGENPDKRSQLVSQLLMFPEDKIIMARREGIRYIIIYKDGSVKNLKKTEIKKLNKSLKKLYEDDFGIIYKTF